MRIPSTLTAGDSASWTEYPFTDDSNSSVDATGYTLQFSIRGSQAADALDLAGTPQGTNWQFALSTVQSAALNTGSKARTLYWAAYATKTGARLTAGTGSLRVLPNLAQSGLAFDGRSRAERNLQAVEDEIEARINGGATVEYTIGNRSLKKEPLAALEALRSRLRLQVSRERRAQQIANGLGNPQRLGVRFK